MASGTAIPQMWQVQSRAGIAAIYTIVTVETNVRRQRAKKDDSLVRCTGAPDGTLVTNRIKLGGELDDIDNFLITRGVDIENRQAEAISASGTNRAR